MRRTGSLLRRRPPFLFVGTTNGLAAFDVSNPTTTQPTLVPITGVTFTPVRIVSSGRRVFFVGAPVAADAGSSDTIPIAWLDVPGTPFVSSLPATSTTTSSPTTDLALVLPTDNRSLFLVNGDPLSLYPTSIVSVPIPRRCRSRASAD